MLYIRRLLMIGLLIVVASAPSAEAIIVTQYFHVQSGTGFFVNREYVITNAHVVRGCESVYIKGAVPEHVASVKFMDDEHDLALLMTDKPPMEFAPLRFDIEGLTAGDRVFVVGYPGEEGARGEYKFMSAQFVVLAQDPMAGTGHFYITDVLEHGNSGGPVFDTSGNVIGVVVAKTVISTLDAQTHARLSEQKLGVAINLATLRDFLQNHGVYTEWAGSGSLFTDSYIEQRTKDYIVNVQCRIPSNGPPGPDEHIITLP